MVASDLVRLLEEGKAVERDAFFNPPGDGIVSLKIIEWPAATKSLFNGGFGSAVTKPEDLLLNLLMEPDEWRESKN